MCAAWGGTLTVTWNLISNGGHGRSSPSLATRARWRRLDLRAARHWGCRSRGRFSMTASTPTSTPWTRPTNSAPGPPRTPHPANRSTSWSWGRTVAPARGTTKYGNANNAGIEGQPGDTTCCSTSQGTAPRALGMSIRGTRWSRCRRARTGKGQQQGGYTGRFTRPSTSVVRAARSKTVENSPASTSTISS